MSLEPQDGRGPAGAPPALNIPSRSPVLSVPHTLATTPIEAAADPREHVMSASLLHFWNILAKWRWPITAVAALGLAAGVVATMITTPIYQATTTIQIDQEPAKVQAVGQQSYSYEDPEKYYLTQYELLKSRALAERVAQNEALGGDDALLNPPETKPFWSTFQPRKPRAVSPAGHAARTAAAASLGSCGLTVVPGPGAHLV